MNAMTNQWSPMHNMQHVDDPKQDILTAVGDISDIKIFGNRVLVAIYKKPEKTKGGIILSANIRKEDEYQGKICLVLKKGASAFKDDGAVKFDGDNVEVGDWIFAPAKYSRSLSVNGVTLRIIEDSHIDGVVPNPDIVI